MPTAIQQMQTYGPGVTLRITDGEQYDVIRDGRHVGTVMDTGVGLGYTGRYRFTAHAFSYLLPQGGTLWGYGMKAARPSLSEAVAYILERSV